MRLWSAMKDRMGPHVLCHTTDTLSREGKFSSCSHFCGEDGKSKILALQYFHKPSLKSTLLMPHLPGISFAVRIETGLLTFEKFYFKICNLTAMP